MCVHAHIAASAGDRRGRCAGAGRSGFTLIELLVTITIFGVAMAALVGGLRGGIKAYEGVKRHHKDEAYIRRVSRILTEDIRHLYAVSEDEPALLEEVRADGGESLTITSLRPARLLRAELPFDLQRVTYYAGTASDGKSTALWRSTTPFAGDTPVSAAGSTGATTEQEILLKGVRDVRFEYVTPAGNVDEWEDKEKLPGTVVVTLSLDGGRTVKVSAWTPLGALGNAPGN